jgi:hypothetical protein
VRRIAEHFRDRRRAHRPRVHGARPDLRTSITDHGHVDVIFPNDFEVIVNILRVVKAHALPTDVA